MSSRRSRIHGWAIYMITVPLAVLAAWIGYYIATIVRTSWEASLLSAALMGISIGWLMAGFSVYYEEMRSERISLPRRPKVRPAKVGKRNKHLDKIATRLARGHSEDILRAGINVTPSTFYYRWVRIAAYSLVAAAPAGIVFAYLLHSPLPLLAAAAPFIVIFLGPEIVVRNAASDRRSGAEDELPFLALYMSVMSSAGITLYEAMKRLIGRGIYRRLEADAVYLQRSVEFMGDDEMTAVDRLARTHPSRAVRDFLYGYSSEIRSGGDVAGYFWDRAEELLRWLQFRFERYADSVSDMGEMMTAMFFVLPAIVLTTAFISPSASMGLVWLMAGLAIPIIGIMVAMIIRSNQPKTGDKFEGNTYMGLAAGIVAGIASYIISLVAHANLPLWAPLAAALVSGSVAFGVPVQMKVRAINDEERSLPDFLRDVTEYRKAGYTVSRAIISLAREGKYSKPLTVFLRRLSASLQMGLRLPEVKARANSWLVNQMVFLLGQVEESGGGTPRDFETMHAFVERYVMAKRMARGRMRLYQMLAIGTPMGLAFLIWIMATFLTKFQLPSLPGAPSLLATSIPPGLFSAAYVMVITAAAFMALSAGTASDFTPLNATRIAVSVLIAALIVFVVSYYGSALSALMPTSVPGMFALVPSSP
ncbi:membrane pilin protein UpsF [Conexivisphaera calida]|nr:type II secretion system F family protein [Conexivisphaera calida]